MGYGVADTGVDFDFVSPKEAHAMLKADKAIFVDSRDTDDFQKGKIQTSYSFPANDIMFRPDKLDKTLVQRCKGIAEAGKLIVCVSDAGISGMQNRGHVSRCRHVAQYLHELGVPKESIQRLQGGLNGWKRLGLDGVLGDTRTYYAGSVISAEKALETERLAVDGIDASVVAAAAALSALSVGSGAGGGEAAGAAREAPAALAPALEPGPRDCGGEAQMQVAAERSLAVPAASQPKLVTSPTVYRVLKGEVYKKASPEAEKIIKLDWAVDRLVRTTGELFVGAGGGKWAQLDTAAGEKKGWVYVEGPGFGPSTRKIISEYLAA